MNIDAVMSGILRAIEETETRGYVATRLRMKPDTFAAITSQLTGVEDHGLDQNRLFDLPVEFADVDDIEVCGRPDVASVRRTQDLVDAITVDVSFPQGLVAFK